MKKLLWLLAALYRNIGFACISLVAFESDDFVYPFLLTCLGLQPVTPSVSLDGLKANIKINDKCHMAHSYTINFCRYDENKKECDETNQKGK